MATESDDKSAAEVESYQDLAFSNAWAARSRGFWATSVIGLAFGAALGLVAPFFPALIGEQGFAAAAGLIPKSLAIFSAIGMGTGFVIGGVVGVSSGGVAAVAEETGAPGKTARPKNRKGVAASTRYACRRSCRGTKETRVDMERLFQP